MDEQNKTNRVDLSDVNKKSAAKKAKAFSRKKAPEPGRDHLGKFTTGSGGLKRVYFDKGRNIVLVLLVALFGGFLVYRSMAAPKAVQPGVSFYWPLSGSPNVTQVRNDPASRKLVDFDSFSANNAASTISQLKSAGNVNVICYFSAGTAEDWRDDYNRFTSSDKSGQLDDWDGEYILDTRSANVRNIMKSRIETMKSQGCDGIEPDNVDGYSYNSGFPLTKQTALDYLDFLQKEAHARDLSIALKNSGDLVNLTLPSGSKVVNAFDWALVEECYQYSECDAYKPFVQANKAVVIVEYGSRLNCSNANSNNFDAYKMDLNLSGNVRTACRTVVDNPGSQDTTPPSVPSGLQATAQPNGGVVLSWTASTDNIGVSGYKVYRGTTEIASPTATNYTDTSALTPGQYTYKVRAYDSAGNQSGDSATVTVTVTSQPTPPPTGAGTGLNATYGAYDQAKTYVVPVLSRIDPTVDFNWGANGPTSAIAKDVFFATWTGKIEVPNDTYNLRFTGDDGYRIWIDGVLVVDNWHLRTSPGTMASPKLAAGKRNIRIEYMEWTGSARAKLEWRSNNAAYQVVPKTALYPETGNGLWGSYTSYDNLWWLARNANWKYLYSVTSPTINFNWGDNGPGQGAPNNKYMATWTGKVTVPRAGQYTFTTTSDDGARLYVGNQRVIDKWTDGNGTKSSSAIQLQAGTKYDIKLEYYENSGNAALQLYWQGPSLSRQIIPTTALTTN